MGTVKQAPGWPLRGCDLSKHHGNVITVEATGVGPISNPIVVEPGV
jgi:hypothetical protein